MPLSPYEALISVYNKNVGNVAQGEDPTFKITKVDAQPLKRKMDCVVGDK